MKYIIIQFKQGRAGKLNDPIVREFPFIFPNAVVHKDMFEMACMAIREETVGNKHANGGHYAHDFKCVGAGTISSMCVKPGCSGKSETLNVKSRGEIDDRLIKMQDYNHGIVL